MSINETIEQINALPDDSTFSTYSHNNPKYRPIEWTGADLKELAAALTWIDCAERLPEYSGYYLGTYSTLDGYKTVYVFWSMPEQDWFWGAPPHYADCIMFWKPLPPPAEKKERK